MYQRVVERSGRVRWAHRVASDSAESEQPSIVILPLPGLGTLELPRALFDKHLLKDRSAEQTGSSPTVEVLDASQLEKRTGVPATWWMSQARERRIPYLKYGRYVRFNYAEVMRCEAFKRHEIKRTGYSILDRDPAT